MHRWRKLTGFDANIVDHGDDVTVNLFASQRGTIQALAVEHLSGSPMHAPKHVAPSNIQNMAPGVAPPVPGRL